MRGVRFEDSAFEDYLEWNRSNFEIWERINLLIETCQRDPFKGIGKPEPLKGKLSGFWSKRINDKHRLIYRVANDTIEIISCSGHYGDK